MKAPHNAPKHSKRAVDYPTYEEYVKSRLQPTGLQLQVIPKSLYNALKENEIKSNQVLTFGVKRVILIL